MTWADLVLNLSKLFNSCLKSEEQRLIWLRNNGWDVGVNDGVVWCKHPAVPEDVMTPSGAVTAQAGFFVNNLVEFCDLPIEEEDGLNKGLVL